MANDTAVPLNRIERVLAFMIGSVAGLSILAIIAVFVGNLAGSTLEGGVWPFVTVLPLVGLTLAFVLIIAFTIVRITRTRRAVGDGS